MIDIHSHILPAVDDGARTATEALDMLRIAADSGVTTQVLTPHIHQGKFNNTLKSINRSFLEFSELVVKSNIKIDLLLGGEVRIGPDIIGMAKKNTIPYLGVYQGRKTFLLEFPTAGVPAGSENLIKWLLKENYLPIIVHPERNMTFISKLSKLNIFSKLGCPIQITSGSLLGKFGKQPHKIAKKLVEENDFIVVASDCHNLKGRAPDLRAGFEYLAHILGSDKALLMVNTIPTKLIKKHN